MNYRQFVSENDLTVSFQIAWPEIEDNYDSADMTEELLEWICFYDKEKKWDEKEALTGHLVELVTEDCNEKFLCMTLWNLDRGYFQDAIDRVLKLWWEERD